MWAGLSWVTFEVHCSFSRYLLKPYCVWATCLVQRCLQLWTKKGVLRKVTSQDD